MSSFVYTKYAKKHLNGPQDASALSVSSHVFILSPTELSRFWFPAFFFFFFNFFWGDFCKVELFGRLRRSLADSDM